MLRRLALFTVASVVALALVPAASGAADDPPSLLTDPYLQLPTRTGVHVSWVTEFEGARHVVLSGDAVEDLDEGDLDRVAAARHPASMQRRDLRVAIADTATLSRTHEDAASRVPGHSYSELTRRELWRHEAQVRGLRPGARVPYRVLSIAGDGRWAASETFTLAPLPRRGDDLQILLTSDHQQMEMTPANLQKVVETVGRVDAVFMAGDLVNIPDRASEWFDDARGAAFFPALQGTASRSLERDGETTTYEGREIIQHAPLYAAVGNHEVMGRIDARKLGAQFNSPLPTDVAATAGLVLVTVLRLARNKDRLEMERSDVDAEQRSRG
jgi:hypothetical protein